MMGSILLFLPLPGTPGRGQGRGGAKRVRDGAAVERGALQPLSLTLSPDYRGEGTNTSLRYRLVQVQHHARHRGVRRELAPIELLVTHGFTGSKQLLRRFGLRFETRQASLERFAQHL